MTYSKLNQFVDFLLCDTELFGVQFSRAVLNRVSCRRNVVTNTMLYLHWGKGRGEDFREGIEKLVVMVIDLVYQGDWV